MDRTVLGSFCVKNLVMMTLPDWQPITTVVPDTAEQDGRNSAGNQSRLFPRQVIQLQSLLKP